MTRRLVLCAGALTACCITEGAAQTAPSAMDPAGLRRSSFTWTQPEREFGFAHWDAASSPKKRWPAC